MGLVQERLEETIPFCFVVCHVTRMLPANFNPTKGVLEKKKKPTYLASGETLRLDKSFLSLRSSCFTFQTCIIGNLKNDEFHQIPGYCTREQ